MLWIFYSETGLNVKKIYMMDLFITNKQACIICGLLWFLISCLDSHSDGTHSLQRSIGEQVM